MEIPSPKVDGVWHAHILDTSSYEKFCHENNAGVLVHHTPRPLDESSAEAYLRTLAKYQELGFGDAVQMGLGRAKYAFSTKQAKAKTTRTFVNAVVFLFLKFWASAHFPDMGDTFR